MKKGQTEGGSMLIGIIISILIVSTFIIFVYLAFSEKEDAKRGFEDFYDFIKGLVENNKDFTGKKPLYVHKDYVIIGFNGEDIKPTKPCYGWVIGSSEEYMIKKPKSCRSGGCLCYCGYKDSIVTDEKEIEKYSSLPEIDELKLYSAVGRIDYKVGRFSKETICTANNYCLDEGLENLEFSGEECGFFFIPGIIKDGNQFIERGIDEVEIEKTKDKVILKSIVK